MALWALWGRGGLWGGKGEDLMEDKVGVKIV